MNCINHPDIPAAAFCRTCGKALCPACERPVQGTVYCAEHVPVTAGAAGPGAPGYSPYTAPVGAPPLPSLDAGASPGLAFLLGLIPGVGAIYNGQYVKGLVHAVIFGFFMSFANAASNTAGAPMFAMLAVAFYLDMPFEAYHTARKRQLGIPVDEWSSLIAQSRLTGKTPVGPIVLILLGVFFLLDSLHLISFQAIGRFWPVILIVAGAGMLYSRLSPGPVGSAGAIPSD